MKTACELYNHITEALALDGRTVVFHIINDGPMAGGMITDTDYLEESDAFLDLAGADETAETVLVWDCVSYMLGTGEADAATAADLALLRSIRETSPRLFLDMLNDYADIPAVIDDVTVQNPYYEEPDSEED